MEKIVSCKLQKENIPDLQINYGKAFYTFYYGGQYNYDYPVIYDIHRHPAERISLFYNDLDLRSNDDILKFKNNDTYILNLNYTSFVIDDKIKEAKSNNRIISNNLSTKNNLNLNMFALSYFFKYTKEKNLLIKFSSCIHNLVPQLIYLYKSCFEESEIFKLYDDNRMKDSILFFGQKVIVDRVKTIKNKLKEILKINREDEIDYKKEINCILKPELNIYVHSKDPDNPFYSFLINQYHPFITAIRYDVYINLNLFSKSLSDINKNISNKYQKELKERLKNNSIQIKKIENE
jgi:hypothetical protein